MRFKFHNQFFANEKRHQQQNIYDIFKSQAKNILVENCINVLNTDQSRDRGLFKFKDQKLFIEKKYLNSSQLRIDLFKLSQVELLHQVFID